MAKVTFGNHSALRVRRAERERIQSFYRDVLGCQLTRSFGDKDDFRIGDDFHIAFIYAREPLNNTPFSLRSHFSRDAMQIFEVS